MVGTYLEKLPLILNIKEWDGLSGDAYHNRDINTSQVQVKLFCGWEPASALAIAPLSEERRKWDKPGVCDSIP